MALIYDTGASLWHDKFTLDKDMDYMYTAKQFGMDGMKPADQEPAYVRKTYRRCYEKVRI